MTVWRVLIAPILLFLGALVVACSGGLMAAEPSAPGGPQTCIGPAANLSAPGFEACGGLGADLDVRLRSLSVCVIGRACPFELVILNAAPSAFSGEIKISGFTSVLPKETLTAATRILPPPGCKSSPSPNLPFECVLDIELAPRAIRKFTIAATFAVPIPVTVRLDALSCATLSGKDFDAVGLLPQSPQQPMSGRNYACQRFSLITADMTSGAAAIGRIEDVPGYGADKQPDTSVGPPCGDCAGDCGAPAMTPGPQFCPVDTRPPPTKRCLDGRVVPLDAVCTKVCPGGAMVAENAACPPQTKRCLDGRVVPLDAVCTKVCPGGAAVAENAACPPPTKRCLDGRVVPLDAVCTKVCPGGAVVAENASCAPPTKRCLDGRVVPFDAVCTKVCPGGAAVAENAACPPPTKRCLDGRVVPLDAVCTKVCPGGAAVAENAACPPPTKRCLDGRVVPLDAACTKVCLGGTTVAENAACPPQTKRCLDGRVVPLDAVCMKVCPGGTTVPETAACPRQAPAKVCADGYRVPINAACLKTCPDGSRVEETAACPSSRCPPGMAGSPPSCTCPPGTRLDLRFQRCVPIRVQPPSPSLGTYPEPGPARCPIGEIGIPPYCACPPGRAELGCEPRIRPYPWGVR